ncbi:hypothetical protein KP509_37G055900 [Ceratopteris richardii]|uniref:tRNA nucleotidyltransferase/poly(A) polymerase RNA and SrmB- binding domain-containing protein n=1 Tax=Ceratopteris richardii TaxID=49495 RepID=A0A8T2Q839_CERRI|nr:hypothetical protein KP509_37G055900 [Ceratopteris richardii]
MLSQEQLWLHNRLSPVAAVFPIKHCCWRVSTVKHLLSRHTNLHFRVLCDIKLQTAARAGHGNLGDSLDSMEMIAGRHGNGKTLFFASQLIHNNAQTLRFPETGTRQLPRSKLETQCLRHCSSQTCHQPRPLRDSSCCTKYAYSRISHQIRCANPCKYSNSHRLREFQEQTHLRMQRHIYSETLTRREITGQDDETPVQYLPKAAQPARPLPKRLLPVPISNRKFSTTPKPSPLRKSVAIADSIQLTELESKIFDVLKNFIACYRLSTQPRVAGGWVRDKYCSLFYNISTEKVEDPTGKGLSDLRAGIIATPLPPKETFTDDPLRALRALRFVSVLDYELHPNIRNAIDADIRLALATKISRERIGAEVEKIFMSYRPLKAMELLLEMQLFNVVFSPPAHLGINLSDGTERTCLQILSAIVEVLSYFGTSKMTVDSQKILYLAAFLSPFQGYFCDHNSKLVSMPTVIIKESLKLGSMDAAMVSTLHTSAINYPSIRKLILKMHTIDQGHGECLISDSDMHTAYTQMKHEIGKLLEQARGLWRSALLLGAVLEDDFLSGSPYEQRKIELKRRANLCIFVEEAIVKLGLEEITGSNPFIIFVSCTVMQLMIRWQGHTWRLFSYG